MKPKPSGKLDSELERALAEELKEVTRKHPKGHENAGQFVYDTMDRCRIIDRCLKLESLKQKVDDPGWGQNFGKPGEAE